MLPRLPWEKRPIEVRNLLNPAFCATVLHGAIKGYLQKQKEMPYPLIFLILPLILHKTTRDSLPKKVDALFNQWVQKNQLNWVHFVKRIHFLNPYTQEAMIFGIQYHAFEITQRGTMITDDRWLVPPEKIWGTDTEAMQCYERAQFIGEWFAMIGTPKTIFQILGICP